MVIWQALIEEILQDMRYNETRIAREVGVTPATIYRIRTGITKEPRYAVAARLMSLYLKIQHEEAGESSFNDEK